MDGIVYLSLAAAQADQAKISLAFGYPICARLNGTVIGSVPTCACVGDGKGANVDASCPYATRRQTDIETVTGPLPATPAAPLPALIVDDATKGSTAALAAVPAAATAVSLTREDALPVRR